MNRPDPNYERQQRLEEVLAVYMQRIDRGERVDREAFVCKYSELADDLRAYFAGADQVEQMAGPQLEATMGSDPGRLSAVPPIDVVRYFGDYELLEEIARGGMGVVFKARQATLNRIVAVKMILSGQLASPADVERFRAEAEAAANLDHPGIVPIFEVGEHQGQHYFSMGYIDGRSLAARVADGPLPAREAAQLIRTVCDSVQYAHEHHVIHRDLKPANILLDGEGRPRVTDFGLAKRGQGEMLLTATGQVLGTPSFMPPEQAQGKLDLVGPAADVYSLGAIFYNLLTGRPPFQAANSMDTLRQVLEKEPLSPRELVSNVPRDLETITLKCLEKSIPQRYASARELGDDLQRFLDGRPILARPVSRVERGWRWCRRNPAVAALSGLAVVLLVAVAVISTAGFARESGLRLIADEQRRAAEKLSAEKVALADAEHQARERADRQSDLALKTMNAMVFDIQRKLKNIPGAESVRRSLLDTAIEGLKQVGRRLDTAISTDRAVMASHNELGDILLLAGGPAGGATEEARKQYESAKLLAERLARDSPQNFEAQRDFFVSYLKLGDVNLQLGKGSTARDAYQKALDISQKLAHDDPQNAQAQTDLSVSHGKLGDAQLQLGNTAAARDAYQKFFEITQKLAHNNPKSVDTQTTLSGSFERLGNAYRQLGNMAAARDAYQKCLEINQKLAHDDTANAEAQRNISISYLRLGQVCQQLGEMAPARDVTEKSLEISQKMAHDDPQNVLVQSDLANSYGRIGEIDQQVGKSALAREAFRKALEINEKLAHDDPQNAKVRDNLSHLYQELGTVALQIKDAVAARDAFQKDLDLHLKLANDDPKNAEAQRNLSLSYDTLADANLQLGNVPAAREAYQKSLELTQKLAHDEPQNTQAQRDLAISYKNFGDVNLRWGDAAAALDAFQNNLNIRLKLARDDTKNLQAQRDLSLSYDALADVNLKLGDVPAAREASLKSLEIRQSLAHDDPKNARAQRDLSLAFDRLGEVSLQGGKIPAAREAYQKSLELTRKLAHDNPQDMQARRDLAISYKNFGDANLRLGDAAAARDAYQENVDTRVKIAGDDPKSAEAQRDLADSYVDLADVSLQLGNDAAARDASQKGLDISRKLAQGDQGDKQAQSNLAYSFGRMGLLAKSRDDYADAVQWFERGVELLEKTDPVGNVADQSLFQEWLAFEHNEVKTCKAALRALDDLDFAVGQPPELVPELLAIRGRVLAKRGKHSDATATADRLIALDSGDSENIFNAARVYVISAEHIHSEKTGAELSVDERAIRERYLAKAVDLLNQALAKGYFDEPQNRIAISFHPDFSPIRDRDDFKKLCAEIAKKTATAPE